MNQKICEKKDCGYEASEIVLGHHLCEWCYQEYRQLRSIVKEAGLLE